MNRAEVYAWVRKPPAARLQRGRRAKFGRRWVDGPCDTCGHAPCGWHKRCPACLTPVPR